MATSPVSSITPPATPIVPPPATQPNKTSDTPPPSSPATPATSSPPPSQSPPAPVISSPPPSPPLTPPPTTSPPPSLPASPPPSPPAAPPPAATLSPPQILTPPTPLDSPPQLKLSPPPPLESSPPSKSSPPPLPSKLSPPPPLELSSPPSKTSPPPQPPPLETSSPPPPLEFAPPPPENSTDIPPPSPPKESPVTIPSPQDPLSPTTSPSPPIAISSPPPSLSFPAPPTNSSTSGSFAPPSSTIPTEKPTARSTTPGTRDSTATSPKDGGMKPGTAIAVGVVVGFLALSLVVLAVWYTRRRKRRNGAGYVMPSPFNSSHNSDSSFMRPQNSPKLAENGSANNFMYSSDPNSKSWFTYEELYDATQGFSSQKLLGEGGFGCVYKGLLVDGREVAVKQLKIGGGQGEREFRAEVEIISRVHHRYLVSLVGYCISDNQRLLVYEYLPNDTLHFHLHGEGRPVMEWSTRVKVAAGAARGIAYLHEDCQPRIIHRDIKSSNILLDNNFDARVADFGLAKLAADANTHVTTRVMGTFGYMAPEYASSGKLTEKSDVFSYGVVLLELVTGRKPVDGSQPIGDESLVEWARPLLSEALETEKFEELIDPRLGDNYNELEMFRLIEAAAACIRHSATKRPRMSQVVRAFDSLNEYPDLTNGMKLGQSEIYNSREQSAQIRMFQRMAFGTQEYSSDVDLTRSSWKSSNSGSST